jgi:GMP synthase (glutamine-hydrolysing)
LEHDRDVSPGLVGAALAEAGLAVERRNVVRQARPELPPAASLAALVVMGGFMNTDQTAQFPGLTAEKALIRAAVQAQVPTLGICLGHQLLAEALGGRVVHAEGFEIGFASLELTGPGRVDPVLGHFASTPVLEWHGDNALAPPGAAVLAGNGFSRCQAFRLGSALGVQFHIEVGPDELGAWWQSGQIRSDWHRHHPGEDLFKAAQAAFPVLAPHARQALAAWAQAVPAAGRGRQEG